MNYFVAISSLTVPFIGALLSIHFTHSIISPGQRVAYAYRRRLIYWMNFIGLTLCIGTNQVLCLFFQFAKRIHRFYRIQFDTFRAILLIIHGTVKSYFARLTIMSQWTLTAKHSACSVDISHRHIAILPARHKSNSNIFTVSNQKCEKKTCTTFRRASEIFIPSSVDYLHYTNESTMQKVNLKDSSSNAFIIRA